MPAVPIVYTIKGCVGCVRLLEKWDEQGVQYEERRADLDQRIMEEARLLGDIVPIVVYPDGKVEVNPEGVIGCYIG
jgi:glutaredoxin